jgi:hypothetical protein
VRSAAAAVAVTARLVNIRIHDAAVMKLGGFQRMKLVMLPWLWPWLLAV